MVGVRAVVLWMVLWNSLVEGHNHLQDLLICPRSGEERRLECDNGEVIDILQARAANLWVIDVLDPCSHFMRSKELILNSWDGWHGVCKKNMTFLRCHGHHSCTVNRTMAEVFLPECPGSAATPGRHSDVLYVRYTCHNPNRLTLPFTDDVTSDMFDIMNQGFPDMTPPTQYNVTCSIKPSDEKTNQMRLTVEAKLIETTGPEQTENTGTCRESLSLSLSGEILFCYRGVYHETLNNIIDISVRDEWRLEYNSDGTIPHRFRINFKATDVGTSDPVQMTISCINNLATTTTKTTTAAATTTTTTTTKTTAATTTNSTTTTTTTITTAATTTITTSATTTNSTTTDSSQSSQFIKEDNQSNNLVIGVSAGAAILVVAVVVAVVVFCRKRRKNMKNQPEPSAAPIGATSNIYYIDPITPEVTQHNGAQGGAPIGVEPLKPPRIPRQAPRSAKHEDMNTVEYADVVVVPSGAIYAQVNKKDKKNEENREPKNPNMLDGETIMVENTELYAKEVVPFYKMAKKDQKKPEHLEEETIMVENSELYAKEVMPLKKIAKNEMNNPQHLEEETIMVENSDLYATGHAEMSDNPFSKDDDNLFDSMAARKLNSNAIHAYHNVGFSKEASQ